ncbi:hypothetical protein DL93DRAFT_342339 [Clavulina sp. PMI_390]|nr:hypothetical protein DL93DRAFT_342339 [Clavulina sp. PMI_390]
MQEKFPFRPPYFTDSDLSPRLSQMRDQLRNIQNVEFASHKARGGDRISKVAKEAIMASLTGIGLNRFGRTIEFGVYKDRTREELDGKSTITGPFAGPGPTLWRIHSTRARQIPLRSIPLATFEELQREFADNSWAFADVFSLSSTHDMFHWEILSLSSKLNIVRPIVIRLWGAAVTGLFQSGVVLLPDIPEIRDLWRSYTPNMFDRAGNALPKTEWFKRFMASHPWKYYESPPDFLEKVGAMFIYELLDGVLGVAIIYPHLGGAKHDPGAADAFEELAYLVEVKYLRLYEAASNIENPTEDNLLLLMEQVDADCVDIDAQIELLKDELHSFHSTVHSVRMLDSSHRQELQAAEQGESKAFHLGRQRAASRAVQVANEDATCAPYDPITKERKLWARQYIEARDHALKWRLPEPFPNPFPTAEKLFDHLVKMKRNGLVVRSLNGVKGNIVLAERNKTAEGQELQEQRYERMVQTRGERRQAKLSGPNARPYDPTWKAIFTLESVIQWFASPPFDKSTPRDFMPQITRCVCGSVQITHRQSHHKCPQADDPKKWTKICKIKGLESVRIFTIHELFSSGFFDTVPDEFLEERGLVQQPSVDCIPSSVNLPDIPAEHADAWAQSFVIYHPTESPQAAVHQALDTCAHFSQPRGNDVDVIFEDMFDPGLPKLLPLVLLGLQRGARIRPIYCNQCPQIQFEILQGSKRVDPVGTERRMHHGPRTYFPDAQTLRLGGDPAQLKRVSDQLRAHVEGEKHVGTIGEEYRSFWELPLAVKQAHIFACFFSDAALAKKTPELVGNVVTVVNWRAPV